jgi:hypothetical protein
MKMEPAAALPFCHAVAGQQAAQERDRNRQGEDERRHVNAQGHGARGGDVDHVVQRGQKQPGDVAGGVGGTGGDGASPDLLLQLGGVRHFLVGGGQVGELFVDPQAGIEILAKAAAHLGLLAGGEQVQAEC